MLLETLGAGAIAVAWWGIQKWWDNRAARGQSRRGELRKKIDDVKRQVQLIETDAHQYFSMNAVDPLAVALERKIHTGLTQVANSAHDIDCALPQANAGRGHRLFKQAITLGDFQSAQRKARTPQDALLDEISAKARAFESSLEIAFRAEFDDDMRR